MATLSCKDISFKSALRPSLRPVTRATAPAVRVSRGISCSAQKQETPAASAAAAFALAAGLALSAAPAQADISGLTPCKDSKAYAKLQKKEVKSLEKRLKKYEAGSAPALALEATIDRTNKRFADYAEKGALCGTDGLPHLISDPGLAIRYGHTGEVFTPTFGFLYIAGWIGYAGRSYLAVSQSRSKPTQEEIIIDVPLALSIMVKCAGWPVNVVSELVNGTLTAKKEDITVSPR
uniref:Photosystem I reaction center subunit III n=1 Tax=Tetraselmis sp. GSL018 TaxID=582737 RepID=A0A061SAC0_9CHLO|eukprot:CAMPEP_0177588862 /NCGR_PEP_ID=MMETSP0419_2-20121207/6467_1 /TAXON_ID=582737 /ORGANISM="Tetraselmis sp., Strain GSL018" /LENGTH=234 /DNA_ID=CAMNT_0019079119 /DNA_START=113 /DNA_END=817 /DNA_ORIENTATION=-